MLSITLRASWLKAKELAHSKKTNVCANRPCTQKDSPATAVACNNDVTALIGWNTWQSLGVARKLPGYKRFWPVFDEPFEFMPQNFSHAAQREELPEARI